jgi:methyltransferase
MVFTFFISFLILQRLAELFVSSKNEKWLLQNGAIEYGKEHYPYIVLLHTLFIISVIAEYVWRGNNEVNYFFVVLFFVLITIKVIVISTLGHYWNTKIYKVPGTIIPLAFNLYYTAVIFTLLNAIMLTVRIKKENEVLAM